MLLAYVNVRAARTVTSRVLARRFAADVFTVDAVLDGWARPAERFGSLEGWVLVDGSSLGVGPLLARLADDEADDAPGEVPPTVARLTSVRERYAPLLFRQPRPVDAEGPLPRGVCAPVVRWRAARPLVLVHAQPSRASSVVEACVQGELLWSGTAAEVADSDRDGAVAHAEAATTDDVGSGVGGGGRAAAADWGGWVRLADPDGWVHVRCPAGFEQLTEEQAPRRHAGKPERELEALDLYVQASPSPSSSEPF